MFVEDMLRLFKRADPAMPEEKERSSQYERQIPATTCSIGSDSERQALADFIRSIVLDELRQLQAVGSHPPVSALADVIRQEVRQAVTPLAPIAPPIPEAPILTYAAALRSPAPPATDTAMRPRYQAMQPFHDTTSSPPLGSRFSSTPTYLPSTSRQSGSKASTWRTSDNRPLCYHCGEAGHVYRNCQYRQLGLRGFHPDARCPRYGERPREIEAYLMGQRTSSTIQHHQSRSPSPRWSTPPVCPHRLPLFSGARHQVPAGETRNSDFGGANYYVNGRQVRGYHVVNVTLHCACSVLVAVVARRVMRITALHACLAAMLFAAHPVHTEAVSSIVGRAEVLCCLFFLLSLLCYHRLLTYSYLCAFNAWLVLCPHTLSYDWQMGSIPLPAGGSREQLCSYNNNERLRGHSLRLLVPLLLTVLPFLPASNLFVTVGFVVAERVLYIPSIGVTLLVAEGMSRLHTWCSRALRWCTTSPCFILVVLFTARTWNRNGVWASREALFESGIRDLPGNAKMHYNYANLQKDTGNSDLAIKHYRLAIELWPDHASAHNNLGTVLTSAEESEHHFRYALHVNPNHPGAHFNLANIYSKQGQKDVARALLKRAVELDPDFSEAYSSLAVLAANRGDLSEGEKLHKMALKSDDRNADARINYGTFLQSQGRAKEAMAQYHQALDIQENHTVALLNAAKSLRSMNLNMQAESLYKRALAAEPDPQVMDNLAVFYVSAGRLDEARELFKDIDKRFPDHRDSKVHYAQLLIQLRSFRAAEDLLLDVIDHNSTDRGALHTAALLYHHINQTVEALDYILKAPKLCAVDDLLCAKIHSDHGDILKDLNDLSSSAQSYQVAIRLDPDLAHAHLNLAVIRHLESDYPAAFRHYQVALSLDPKNKLIVDNMAKLRRRIARPLAFHDCV
ncbi:hypothetical protein HPB51_008896 [Rhipicephalus microplus]|uniref:dolichyl-phosphate-mannose--protein mannosyltransferase n=1 Tax=Rhipicephalus microplus TaxID=6941 RepID=A0A9J6EN10_RHIMP|nr:hypothetical protein HPB51_008896 [Rhipicephalus microplus]